MTEAVLKVLLSLDVMQGLRLQDAVVSAALQHAHRAAVTFDSGSGPEGCVSLSYQDLVARGNRLASSLRDLCGENNGFIGL